jgi:hypothetical protein
LGENSAIGQKYAMPKFNKYIRFCLLKRIHIRRTDKIGTEAEYHPLSEYMRYVKDYYDVLDIQKERKVNRTVYLATDDLEVFKELKKT